jgi:hypothetical protein
LDFVSVFKPNCQTWASFIELKIVDDKAVYDVQGISQKKAAGLGVRGNKGAGTSRCHHR